MPKRRRYATRDELVALLAEHINVNTTGTVNESDVAAVVDALAEHEVPINALVLIAVDEPFPS